MMSAPFEIRELVESFRRSTGAAADSGSTNSTADRILAAGARGKFELWDEIEREIGAAETPRLRDLLLELRARFVDTVVETEIAGVELASQQSIEEGWTAWQIAIADAISRFRHPLGIGLCEHVFRFQDRTRPLAKAVRCACQSRWPEVYGPLDTLTAKEFIPPATRLRLLVILGEINLYHFSKPDRTRAFLEAAQKIDPDDVRIIGALGDYHAGRRNWPQAEEFYERTIRMYPKSTFGYVGMGEIAENTNEVPEAEGWYRKAIQAASGETLGYERLIRLYSRSEFFEAHEQDVLRLSELSIAITPEGAYRSHINLGDAYSQNKRYEEAQGWYTKAMALDPTNPDAYVCSGASYEKSGKPEEAEANYQRAIEVAPECYDGYWKLTGLYQQQHRWREALECYKKEPTHWKEWSDVARATVAEMHVKLNEHAHAEELLKQQLRADHDNKAARDVLFTIALAHYSERKDQKAARRLYAEMLEILGKPFEGDYHNRLGNLNYDVGDYEKAAEEYRRAIAGRPDNAVYHRNLATACRTLKHREQAVQALNTARELDEDDVRFKKDMALLVNDEGNEAYGHGDYRKAAELFEKAIEYHPDEVVFYANLAAAWEQVEEPGQRMDALERAQDAYRRAYQVSPNREHQENIERLSQRKALVASYGEKVLGRIPVVTPIAIEVANDLIPLVEDVGGAVSAEALKHLADIRTAVEERFGNLIPGVRIRGNETDLSPGRYVILLMEIPIFMGSISTDQRYYPGNAESLSQLGVKMTPASRPLTGESGFWIRHEDWPRVLEAGLPLWSVIQYLFMDLEAIIRRNLADFITHDEVARLMKTMPSPSPGGSRPSKEKLSALTAVCRALAAEQTPLTPFAAIYEVFDRDWFTGVSLQGIVETIRSLPVIAGRVWGSAADYMVLPLAHRFETEIGQDLHPAGAHGVLAMEPERCQAALTAVRNAQSRAFGHRHALLVHDPKLRPYLRRLIELEFPSIPVLSRTELLPDASRVSENPIDFESLPPPATPPPRDRPRLDGAVSSYRADDSSPVPATIEACVVVNAAFVQEFGGADDQPLENLLALMADGLFYELGVILPEVRIDFDDQLSRTEFRFRLNGRDYRSMPELGLGEYLVNETPAKLAPLGIKGRQAINPANGSECAIVSESDTPAKTCRDAGLTAWGPAGFLVLTLAAKIRRSAADFQTDDITAYMLRMLRTAFPELTETAVQRFSTDQIARVLRSLLQEEISIRDLGAILESMLAINGTCDIDQARRIIFTSHADQLCMVNGATSVADLSTNDYSNCVRASSKRYISHKYTRGAGTLLVYLLDADIESMISRSEVRPLTDEEKGRFNEAVLHEIGNLPAKLAGPVVLTSMGVRRLTKKLLEATYPNLPVLCYQELSPDLNIQPIGRVSWDSL